MIYHQEPLAFFFLLQMVKPHSLHPTLHPIFLFLNQRTFVSVCHVHGLAATPLTSALHCLRGMRKSTSRFVSLSQGMDANRLISSEEIQGSFPMQKIHSTEDNTA